MDSAVMARPPSVRGYGDEDARRAKVDGACSCCPASAAMTTATSSPWTSARTSSSRD